MLYSVLFEKQLHVWFLFNFFIIYLRHSYLLCNWCTWINNQARKEMKTDSVLNLITNYISHFLAIQKKIYPSSDNKLSMYDSICWLHFEKQTIIIFIKKWTIFKILFLNEYFLSFFKWNVCQLDKISTNIMVC